MTGAGPAATGLGAGATATGLAVGPAATDPAVAYPAADGGISLRPWSLTDAPDLQRTAAVTPDLSTQTGGADLSTVDLASRFIAEHLIAAGPARYEFAIVIDQRVVGNVGLSNIEHRHDTAWTYYWVAADARGRGIATGALTALADWAFDALDLHRIELGHRVNNPASCLVAKRAGFAEEGIERDKLKYGADRFDVETHARLRTDTAPQRSPGSSA